MSETKTDLGTSQEFRMFVCGPTVQDNVHLGHAKTYLAFDVLARWLLKSGRKVFFLLNITDVDDKIFDRAKKENVPYGEIADRFYKAFLEDLEALNILTISRFARVSNFVDESAALVKTLLDRSAAYRLEGSVYFDISKADHFGKLSHQSAHDLKMKQIDAAPGKKNSVDFLLWRAIPDDTEGIWDTVVGLGWPGWHIQDSAIAFEELGGPYHLHGGATESDLSASRSRAGAGRDHFRTYPLCQSLDAYRAAKQGSGENEQESWQCRHHPGGSQEIC